MENEHKDESAEAKKIHDSGKKFYYIAYMEFIVQRVVGPNQPGSIINYNSVITNSHPFIWKAQMTHNKGTNLYNIHITGWQELSREEYELAIKIVHQLTPDKRN